MSKNLSYLSGRKELEENLFDYIGHLSEANGNLPESEIPKIAEHYLMGNSTIFGTASFYDFTRSTNATKKIYVCNGSACLVAKTQEALKNKISENFKDKEIGEMCCLGRCHENNAFQIDGKNYSGKDIDMLEEILQHKKTTEENYNVKHIGESILTTSNLEINDYIKLIKKLVNTDAEHLLSEIKSSGLRGRGGAGFPIAIKLEGCRKAVGKRKFIVCNADEGDPGSYSDRYLLEKQPMKVLLGMIISAYITGADRGVVYIRAEYPESVTIINAVVEQLRSVGIIGDNIFGSNFSFQFKVIKAQGAYICGEETALLSSIEGQRPEVRVRPPFPVEQGLFRQPTVVNNVETLANLYYILDHGGATFSKFGTTKSTGTKLISLDSGFKNPGIYEVPMGTKLFDVIEELGGGFSKPIKALHIGGPLGGLVPIHKIQELTVDFESFAQAGFMLGHASIVSVPEDYPMIKYLEHLFEFTAHESCGKCFPCRIGSVRGKEMIQKAQKSIDYKIDEDLLYDLLDTMKKGSLCALGGGIPLPVYNALQYFKPELETYFLKK